MKTQKIYKDTNSLVGKRVAVSGATGGIGRELCRHLCRLGASLVLLDRNAEKSARLADTLKSEHEGLEITLIRVDMENMQTVRAAADELINIGVDYLILNAGAYSIPRHKCDTGYDNVFQINFVAPYYLARRLLPHISARGGRAVCVGSIAHNYSKIDENDIDFSKRERSSLVYGNAKRHLMFSFYGLQGNIAVTHPGITLTGITAHYPRLVFVLIKYPMKIIFMSPKKASLCILAGLFDGCLENEWIGPRVFDIWGYPKKKGLHSCSREEAEFICERAERIYRELDGH